MHIITYNNNPLCVWCHVSTVSVIFRSFGSEIPLLAVLHRRVSFTCVGIQTVSICYSGEEQTSETWMRILEATEDAEGTTLPGEYLPHVRRGRWGCSCRDSHKRWMWHLENLMEPHTGRQQDPPQPRWRLLAVWGNWVLRGLARKRCLCLDLEQWWLKW